MDSVVQVAAFLKELFSEEPTYSLDSYLASAILDKRRDSNHAYGPEFLDPIFLSPPRIQELFALEDMPSMPAEAALLSAMGGGKDSVRLVRSGSGSGKTSVVVALANYCERVQARIEKKKGAPMPAGAIMRVIDFQDQSVELKEATASPEVLQQKVLRNFSRLLEHAIGNVSVETRNDALRRIVGARVQHTYSRQASVVQRALKDAVEGRFHGNPVEATLVTTTLQTSDAALEQAHDRVAARLLLLREIAKVQWESDFKCPLILVIDNVDPFPEDVQNCIIRTIKSVFYGMRADRPQHSGLIITIFARLSTARRHSGSLDGIAAITVTFFAPDPGDVVFFRLASFLVEPESVGFYQQLSPLDRAIVFNRCISLFERLVDQQGEFFRIFAGLSGTNIRTGCKLAAKWVLSKSVPAQGPADRTTPDVRATVASALYYRIAIALERSLRSGETPEAPEDLLKAIDERLSGRVTALLYSSRLISKTAGGWLDLRGDVVRRVPLGERVAQHALPPLSQAVSEFTSAAGVEPEGRAAFAATLRQWLETPGRAMAPGTRDPVQEALLSEIRDAIVSGAATTRLAREDWRPSRLMGDFGQTKPTKWESSHLLISEPKNEQDWQDDEGGHVSAVNVFTVDGRGLCPVALHVLSMLRASGRNGLYGRDKDGLKARALADGIRERGFKESELRDALVEMVQIDRRLVYSGVMDQKDGVDHWFNDSSRTVHLSSAGREYLEHVVPTAVYMQWAMSGVQSIAAQLSKEEESSSKADIGSERLSQALNALRYVAGKEMERSRAYAEQVGIDHLKTELIPFAEVFFLGLDGFVADAVSLRRYVGEAAAHLGEGFIKLARKLYDFHVDVFDREDVSAEMRLTLAEERFDRGFLRGGS